MGYTDLELRIIVGTVQGLKQSLRDTDEYKKRVENRFGIV